MDRYELAERYVAAHRDKNFNNWRSNNSKICWDIVAEVAVWNSADTASFCCIVASLYDNIQDAHFCLTVLANRLRWEIDTKKAAKWTEAT